MINVHLSYEELIAMDAYAKLPGTSPCYRNDVPRLLAERDALVKERDALREQAVKLREACLSLLGAAENETNALPSTIVMARNALAQTEAL